MANVCVIGLGRIGLPLALLLARANHKVIGVDSNRSLLSRICNNSLEWLNADSEKKLIAQHLNENLSVTHDLPKALSDSGVVFISIGTGVGSDGSPELSSLFSLFGKICSNSENVKDKLFILKSTLPIGTTRRIAAMIEKKTGLVCGSDFFLAFCPERVLGDKALSEMASLPKIIGGLNEDSSKKAAMIYETIGGKIVIVSSPEIAEMVKLLDNSYRQTMFAFANDFALLAEQYNINAYEVIKSANDSYPRNNIPFPSGGVGGYCLTKDPLYLESSFGEIAAKRGFNSVWFMARKTNDYMPLHVMDLLRKKLECAGKGLKDSNVLVCGIAYKENTDDIRNSHGLEIARRLQKQGANIFLWDPKVSEPISGFRSVEKPEEVLPILDAMIFTIKHDEFLRYKVDNSIMHLIGKMRTPVVIDGWGIFQHLIGRSDVFYTSVGIKG